MAYPLERHLNSGMPQIAPMKIILGGYAVAGFTLILGFFLSLKVSPVLVGSIDVGTLYLRAFYLLALAIVFNFTLAWGRMRGFPLRLADGSFSFMHLLRISVMTAIVWFAVCFLSGPVALFLTRQ